MLENKWAKEGDAILKKFTGAPSGGGGGGGGGGGQKGAGKAQK